MERRQFIKFLSAMSIYLMDLKQLFAKNSPLLPPDNPASALTVFTEDKRHSQSIPISFVHEQPYVSILKLATVFSYHTYINSEKQKIVVYLPQNKIVVSAGNPFVIIDSKARQMPANSRWADQDIQVPLAYFAMLVNRYTTLNWHYDPKQLALTAGSKGYNTTGVKISLKENGLVLRIRTALQLKPGEMSVDMRYDWLHVDLFGGQGDLDAISSTTPVKPVREVKAYQFKDLLSIAFRLQKPPMSKEIYQDELSNEVVVILRYDEQLAQEDPQQDHSDADPPNKEADDDLQKQLEQEKKRWMIDTIVIDPGHGGKDPGAIGHGKLKEKDVVLGIGKRLGKLIEKRMPDVKVVYTRKSDRFVPLRERTEIANRSKGKVFISIHANASKSRRAAGFETYLLGPEKGNQASNVAARENSVIQFESAENQEHYQGINAILAQLAQTAYMKQSEHLASGVQTQLHNRLRSIEMKNRGVKQAGFWVMVGASMPCILVETGFITNPFDARVLKTKNHQQKIAEGIFAGLAKFKNDYESAI